MTDDEEVSDEEHLARVAGEAWEEWNACVRIIDSLGKALIPFSSFSATTCYDTRAGTDFIWEYKDETLSRFQVNKASHELLRNY